MNTRDQFHFVMGMLSNFIWFNLLWELRGSFIHHNHFLFQEPIVPDTVLSWALGRGEIEGAIKELSKSGRCALATIQILACFMFQVTFLSFWLWIPNSLPHCKIFTIEYGASKHYVCESILIPILQNLNKLPKKQNQKTFDSANPNCTQPNWWKVSHYSMFQIQNKSVRFKPTGLWHWSLVNDNRIGWTFLGHQIQDSIQCWFCVDGWMGISWGVSR